MSEWLFDLGNSRLKYARRDAGGAIGGMDSLCLLYTSPSPRD